MEKPVIGRSAPTRQDVWSVMMPQSLGWDDWAFLAIVTKMCGSRRAPQQHARPTAARGSVFSHWSLASSGLLALAQPLEHIVDREAIRRGASQQLGHDSVESPLPANPVHVRSALADERSPAWFGFQNSFDLELAVGAYDRIRANGKVRGELTNRRQLVARPQAVASDRRFHLLDDLPAKWRTAVGVNQDSHGHYQ
jgi:hypothetical protein